MKRIKITIESSETVKYTETVNFITKSTPTEIVEQSHPAYGGGSKSEIKCVEEYASKPVEKERIERLTLLEQTVDAESFDLKAVISAINGLGK